MQKHVMNGREHRRRDCEDRLPGPAASFQAKKLSAEVAVPGPDGRPGRLHQRGFQPPTAATGSRGAAFAGALVHARAESRPRDEVSRRGEAAHIDTDLSDEDSRDGVAHAWNGAQEFGGVSKGGESLAAPRLHLSHRPLQRVDLVQMKLQKKDVVVGQTPLQGCHELRARDLQPTSREIRETLGVALPCERATRMARPLAPRISLRTSVSLRWASSRTFWIRCVWREPSRTSCVRVRVRSRRSLMAGGGTKLPRMSPCASRSASQVASLMSVFRPGMFRTCVALARTSSHRPSSVCQIGLQYTPVASMHTWVQPCAANQSASASRSRVVVPNTRWKCIGPFSDAIRAHPTTLF